MKKWILLAIILFLAGLYSGKFAVYNAWQNGFSDNETYIDLLKTRFWVSAALCFAFIATSIVIVVRIIKKVNRESMAMSHSDKEIFDASIKKLAEIFKIPIESIQLDYQFGKELDASFVSDWSYNELDQVLHDVRDVADRNIIKELEAGNLIIETLEKYCNHMIRCYKTEPKEVIYALGLDKS